MVQHHGMPVKVQSTSQGAETLMPVIPPLLQACLENKIALISPKQKQSASSQDQIKFRELFIYRQR